MEYTGEPITVIAKLEGDRWWVWLGDKRLIGFKDKRSAIHVAMNIADALKGKGIATNESSVC